MSVSVDRSQKKNLFKTSSNIFPHKLKYYVLFFFVIKATVSHIVATIQTKRHAEMNERKSAKELWRILQDGES